MVEQPNSLSNSIPSSGTANPTRTDSTPEDEQDQILRRLESTVETFRSGNSSKMSTTTFICRILREDSAVTIIQSQKEATFNSYLTEILSIQSTFDESNGADNSGAKH